MKATAARKPKRKKFRKDSYEGSLTEKQRMSLYAMLFDADMTLHEIQAKTVSWQRGAGKNAGKPELPTLSKIRNRLRLENMLFNIDGATERIEAIKRLIGPMAKAANQERLLDQIMAAISAEVMDRTLERLNPEARSSATRLLLKRADQRRVDRRLDMAESEMKKDEKNPDAPKLTAQEKQTRIRQIFGIL